VKIYIIFVFVLHAVIRRESKNVPPLACLNFDTRQWILIFLAEMLSIR